MKARGRWLFGIDFDAKDGEPRVLAVPMRGNSPMWNHTEVVDKDDLERIIDDARRKARDRRDQAERDGG
jgi:hypothetical protein